MTGCDGFSEMFMRRRPPLDPNRAREGLPLGHERPGRQRRRFCREGSRLPETLKAFMNAPDLPRAIHLGNQRREPLGIIVRCLYNVRGLLEGSATHANMCGNPVANLADRCLHRYAIECARCQAVSGAEGSRIDAFASRPRPGHYQS